MYQKKIKRLYLEILTFVLLLHPLLECIYHSSVKFPLSGECVEVCLPFPPPHPSEWDAGCQRRLLLCSCRTSLGAISSAQCSAVRVRLEFSHNSSLCILSAAAHPSPFFSSKLSLKAHSFLLIPISRSVDLPHSFSHLLNFLWLLP